MKISFFLSRGLAFSRGSGNFVNSLSNVAITTDDAGSLNNRLIGTSPELMYLKIIQHLKLNFVPDLIHFKAQFLSKIC